MTYKRPFDEVMREFTAKHPDEVDNLSAEEIAERTGYTLNTVRDYLSRHHNRNSRLKTEDQTKLEESGAVTYVTSSGKASVIYYPYIGEVKITNAYGPRQTRFSWNTSHDPWIMLSPEDCIEIGIYLLGLQPHIRDVIARRDSHEM